MDWGTQEVLQWLNDIGLSKYVKRFKGYFVNGAVLWQLDEALLDDLEIRDVSDREILLSESENLKSKFGIPSAGANLSNHQAFDMPIITVSSFEEEEGDNEELNVVYDKEEFRSLNTKSYAPQSRLQPTSHVLTDQRFINLSYSDEGESTTDDGSERDFSFKDSDEEHEFDFYDEQKDIAVEATPAASVVATRATQMVELLSQENVALREKLESVYNRMENVETLEFELESMRVSYDQLQLSAKKRERLENSMRARMETEIGKLQEKNKHLRDEFERGTKETTQIKASLKNLTNNLKTKDDVIKQLITQGNSFISVRDDLERTVKQQKGQIEDLQKDKENVKSSLVESQQKISQLEEELTQMETYSNYVISSRRVRALQNARRRGSTKSTSTIKDEHYSKYQDSSSTDEGIAELDGPTSVPILLEILKEKDERIKTLESDLLQLEETFLQESTSRQLALRAACMPKEARIAALQNSLQESEKIIAECRGQNLKYIEELYVANRRCADLEAIIKSLHSQLAEKNTRLRTLEVENDDDDDDDEPNQPEWPSNQAFSRTDFTHMKDFVRDLTDVESLDSGMSVTNVAEVRQIDTEFKPFDEPDNVSVHFWSV